MKIFAAKEHVSVSTVGKYKRAFDKEGRIDRLPASGGHQYLLNERKAAAIVWIVVQTCP